jgi:hypothetical protein
MSSLEPALALLAAQRTKQSTLLPQFGPDKVLSVMATSASPGTAPTVGLRRIASVSPGSTGAELEIALHGRLPREPERGECIAVAAAVVRDFRGYQMKTHALIDPAFASRLHGADAGGARVHAAQVFTIQQGPKSADYFEKLPFEEVSATVAQADYALVAVGEQANLSPRWILHHELRDGALELYSGDAFWSKTWLNVRRNPRELRLVFDPETGTGFAMEGVSAAFAPEEHPVAAGRIQEMFGRIGVKKIARMTRLRVERIRPIAVEG